MTEPRTDPCDPVRELVPELAMGVASGDERAFALRHMSTCAECRAALEDATGVVDELLLLAPEHEPPPGFEARVLAAMDVPTRRRRRSIWVAAAAAAVVLTVGAAGVTRWADADDRRLAEQYRDTLEVADGSYLKAADLVADSGEPAGHVFAYEGKPSWLFMTVEGAPSGTYEVRVVTRDGRTYDIGECWVGEGRGSWGTTVDVPIRSVQRIEMRGDDGSVLVSSFA